MTEEKKFARDFVTNCEECTPFIILGLANDKPLVHALSDRGSLQQLYLKESFKQFLAPMLSLRVPYTCKFYELKVKIVGKNCS